MHTADENLEILENLFEDRREKQCKKVEFCDLCGISDSHLVEGLCNQCRTKYKIEDKK